MHKVQPSKDQVCLRALSDSFRWNSLHPACYRLHMPLHQQIHRMDFDQANCCIVSCPGQSVLNGLVHHPILGIPIAGPPVKFFRIILVLFILSIPQQTLCSWGTRLEYVRFQNLAERQAGGQLEPERRFHAGSQPQAGCAPPAKDLERRMTKKGIR